MENNYSDFVGQGMDVGNKFIGESSSADGTKTKAGQFLSGIKGKATSAFQNAKQSGALSNLGNSLLSGIQGNQNSGQSSQTQSGQGAVYGSSQGMSIGTKMGIAVGLVLVIGVIIWLATKK